MGLIYLDHPGQPPETMNKLSQRPVENQYYRGYKKGQGLHLPEAVVEQLLIKYRNSRSR